MASTHDSFAVYLRAAMEAAGMPRAEEVAAATHGVVKVSTVYRWLRPDDDEGERSPRRLRAVATALNVPVMDMFIAAGVVMPEEAGREGVPSPPEVPSIEDQIRTDPRVREGLKEPLIQLLEALTEEHAGRSPARTRRTNVPLDQDIDTDVNEEQSG